MCIKGNRTITYFWLPAFERDLHRDCTILHLHGLLIAQLMLIPFSVFSEEEPDLNSELEISVGDFNTLNADQYQFCSDHRDGGGNRWPTDGEAADGSDPWHDGVRLPRLHLPGQQLLRAHRTSSTKTGTPAILRWEG